LGILLKSPGLGSVWHPMKALRPLIHALLALVFLVQGVAVAAAEPYPPTTAKASPALQQVHCHPEAVASMADQDRPDKKSCCHAGCPDMVSCALAAAILPAPPAVPTSLAAQSPGAFDGSHYRSAPPGAAFRPPIRIPA
jgi:hypothetical protein